MQTDLPEASFYRANSSVAPEPKHTDFRKGAERHFGERERPPGHDMSVLANSNESSRSAPVRIRVAFQSVLATETKIHDRRTTAMLFDDKAQVELIAFTKPAKVLIADGRGRSSH